MVVSPTLIDRLADPKYIERLRVRHSGYLPRRERIHDFAQEWQRLVALPETKRSSATDKIWQVTVRDSRWLVSIFGRSALGMDCTNFQSPGL